MAIATRVNATNASVYTIDGVSWLADIIDCEVTINNTTEDAKGAVDRWSYAAAVGSDWQFSGNFFADSAIGTSLAQYGTANPPRFAVAFTDGADVCAGTITITSIVKQYSRETLTKYALTGAGWGSVTVT